MAETVPPDPLTFQKEAKSGHIFKATQQLCDGVKSSLQGPFRSIIRASPPGLDHWEGKPYLLSRLFPQQPSLRPLPCSLFVCLGLHLQPMEVPRLGAESELLAYTTATAMPDPGCICNLCCSPQQARDP